MRTSALLVAGLIMISASAANADVLYLTTPTNTSVRSTDFGVASQSGYRTFDDFVLGIDATVQTVRWSGIWIPGTSGAPAPAPDVTTWDVAFYADAAGTPGALLASHSFAAADVSSTFLGTQGWDFGDPYNTSVYAYAATLPSGFGVTAGERYWLSVFSTSPSFSPQFAWYATAGNGTSLQQQLGAGMSVVATNEVARNRAFGLDGSVPEPGTLLLLGTAAAGLTLRRRRNR